MLQLGGGVVGRGVDRILSMSSNYQMSVLIPHFDVIEHTKDLKLGFVLR